MHVYVHECLQMYLHTYTYRGHKFSSVLSFLSKAEGDHGEEAATSQSRNTTHSLLRGRNLILTEMKSTWQELTEVSQACCFIVTIWQKIKNSTFNWAFTLKWLWIIYSDDSEYCNSTFVPIWSCLKPG